MSFEDITPQDFVEEGAEEQEVADPVESVETGAEEPEVADPESEPEDEESDGKTEADSRFAEMRRQLEAAEAEKAEVEAKLAEYEQKALAREAAMEEMDVDDIDAIADQAGISREEVLAVIEREEQAAAAELEAKEKDQRITELEEELQGVYVEKAMEEDLADIQKLDPKVKSLDDLGEDFAAYISAGLTARQAFFAIRGEEITTRSTPPTAPGKIADTAPPAKDYFTEEEVAAMTSEEKTQNAEKIMQSLPHWK